MNALELKQKRKDCGLTQEKLAKLIGVSTRTISNYEKGEVIPETKHEILRKILNENTSKLVNESSTDYESIGGYSTKIQQLIDRIKEHNAIIELSSDPGIIEHQKEIIKLLNTQISIIKDAQKNHLMDK